MKYKKLFESTKAFQIFKSDFMTERLAQAYLFVCEDGLTASHIASEVARLLVCDRASGCGICASCQKATALSHPDILVYPKGKKFATSDASSIYDNVQIKPIISNKKVFIINSIDVGNEQAQNKMLKIIEEPPQNVIFLITASNENKVLSTIKSRSRKIVIDRLNKDLLKDVIDVGEEIKEIAISNGDGYLGKTLEIATNEEYLKIYKNIQNIIFNLKNSSGIPLYSKLISENNNIFNNSLLIFNDFFNDILMLKLNKEKYVKNTNLMSEFMGISEEYSILALNEILKKINSYKRKLDSNVNLLLLADNLLLEILEVKFLCK